MNFFIGFLSAFSEEPIFSEVMATKAATKRLMKEYAALQQAPPPFIIAKPSEKNILEWHYVITGPPDSPYHCTFKLTYQLNWM
jgi:ubiquitin-protein ligase